ncbi:neuropilin and tolloid-like protein 2 [Leguminivora glycinivorella]|uniref:neuropilin and tolloid-like protein 2 n=1 Tax=Leguminivora glycinivorella TaxID=1035111 RepID=UPI0020102590|nr:neuropilin and tolloid-like protein 2 [Leguminivora glycinivorella]XP_048000821.1 neuropilin and tolloid-like protein 2 [Leguminivora glycinivorella]
MVPLAFLALASIIGTTAPADHGRNLIPGVHGTNFRPHLLYSKSAMVHYRKKRDTSDDPRCAPFMYEPNKKFLTNPINEEDQGKPSDKITYSNRTTCITTIDAGGSGQVIVLSFVDKFHMEDRPPKCEYDYLEIRDGKFGYALPAYKFCGSSFPPTITSAGPSLWLKFQSDDSIEYSGFKINIDFQQNSLSREIPEACIISKTGEKFGWIASDDEDAKACLDESPNTLDIQWRIETPANTRIYLNFTEYKLSFPNECEDNLVQVFGAESNFDHKLAFYCGSVANPVTTKAEDEGLGPSNIMFVRMFATTKAKASKFMAHFTSFRTLKGDQSCDPSSELDCQDGTCIDSSLACNGIADCRLKSDEDPESCKEAAQSLVKEPHILVILIIFSLILSGMSLVFLFKCIRKLHQDHKYIKEHLAKSCEDRLDKLAETQLTLDPNLLDPEPRASLERENHTNEMYKQQRNKRKSSSIESDFLHRDTSLDHHHDWPESIPVPEDDIRIEYKGRPRRSDTSKKEESLRSKGSKEEERKEIRDVSVGAPDTKESGCQTRESLFQVDTAPSSDGTNSSNSRGFSTFGYSGATIVRPSPAPANTSEITIELLRQVTPQESIKQKKFDRRPMSSETTRSAPDVIIVSKPIR